jgi:tetratricopeptide (TPR) repeat protein
MSPVRHLASCAAFAFFCLTSVSWAADAGSAFLEGNKLVAQGDMRGAYKAYTIALKADRSNSEYAQQYMLVRRILLLEDALSKETDGTQRIPICESLRAFYVSHGLHSQALPLDKEVFELTGTANAAILLAETHLALKHEQDAIRVLEGLDSDTAKQATQGLLAVALARAGKIDEAREIADKMSKIVADTGTLYISARMRAAIGQERLALSDLVKCFESVPPSRLGALKSHAKSCVDFASLASTDGFADALKTESKVTESSCSGGSNCSTCPMRGSCSGGH